MNTRIFLIRHGATTLTAEDRFAGATDVPLSDMGREQVRRLPWHVLQPATRVSIYEHKRGVDEASGVDDEQEQLIQGSLAELLGEVLI